MIVAEVEFDKEPRTPEEWARVVDKVTEGMLKELRESGAPESVLKAAEAEMREMGKKLPERGIGAFAAESVRTIIKDMLKMGDRLPTVLLTLGRDFSKKGEHSHNFMMGVAQSEVATALACLEHAIKVLDRATGCECKGDEPNHG